MEEEPQTKVQSIYRKYLNGLLDDDDVTPSKITDYLFLGSIKDAVDGTKITGNGISNVLSLHRLPPNKPSVYDSVNHKFVDAHDTDDYPIQKHFEETYQFIKEAKNQNQPVLVHCAAGVSRSATVVVAYLMREYNLGAQEALVKVKEKRNCICPNPGFLRALFEYKTE
eukprot:TRINITY_DN9102_c0_g1_i1.p1 TRINITY_DN9102_c0_g1~~TRINITY_DN9102_c0_g1_i1.p1  ORF type:complete len:168 (+),score=30.93 TRINITY_DN9102_c0_g1_i1:1-504(+)